MLRIGGPSTTCERLLLFQGFAQTAGRRFTRFNYTSNYSSRLQETAGRRVINFYNIRFDKCTHRSRADHLSGGRLPMAPESRRV